MVHDIYETEEPKYTTTKFHVKYTSNPSTETALSCRMKINCSYKTSLAIALDYRVYKYQLKL